MSASGSLVDVAALDSRKVAPRGVAALTSLALLASALPARADVAACVDAHEKGQQARTRGAMREALRHFLECGVDDCPASVRRDCLQWGEEVAALLPSVVIGVRDTAGNDVIDVRVTIDGLPSGETLDGRAIPLDPGPHDVEVDGPTVGRVVKRVLVREGDRARKVDIVVQARAVGTVVPPAGAAGGSDPAASSGNGPSPGSRSGPGIGQWAVMGGGGLGLVAGLVLLVVRPEYPQGCDPATRKCVPLGSAPDVEERAEQAGRSDGLGAAGAVSLIAGSATLVGGLVWYLVAPPRSRRAQVSAAPWLTPSAAGAGFAASF